MTINTDQATHICNITTAPVKEGGSVYMVMFNPEVREFLLTLTTKEFEDKKLVAVKSLEMAFDGLRSGNGMMLGGDDPNLVKPSQAVEH